MNFQDNSNLNHHPSITVNHTHNSIHNFGGVTVSNPTINDHSTTVIHQHRKPAKIARRNPPIYPSGATRHVSAPVGRHIIPAPALDPAYGVNHNGGNYVLSGTTPARPAVAAQAQAATVANGVNPRRIPIPNTYRHVRTVNPDQRVNQIPDNPLPPIHVYEQPGYYKVSRPYKLSASSAKVHRLEPISDHSMHPLLLHFKGKEKKGIPLYFGVDPTSNTNFIISTRK